MNTLKDLFHDDLKELYDAELRSIKALSKLIRSATCPKLRDALHGHLQETEGHVTRLEAVFESIGEKPKAKKCQAAASLLEESDRITSRNKGAPALNAAIISAGQKVEHYEIAAYGCLYAWAVLMGNYKAAGLIGETLEEEKAADNKLSKLAVANNQDALRGDTSKFGNNEEAPFVVEMGWHLTPAKSSA